MASLISNSTSELNVSLHPLPILSISEHLTRTKLQKNSNDVKVLGALLGVQAGRDVEIMNSFEIAFEEGGDHKAVIDHGFLDTRSKQFKQVFPTFELLGWYSVGLQPSEFDLDVLKQLAPYNESPLFLQLSSTTASRKDLPLSIYEPIVEIFNNASRTMFVKCGYRIETGEAERIAVDHTAKPSTFGTSAESALVSNLMTQRNAIQMLHERVQVIMNYLAGVHQGNTPPDLETLRQISSLVSSLPATDSLAFRKEFVTERDDVLLTNYLVTLTRTLARTNTLLEANILTKENTAGPTRRRTGRGDGFSPMYGDH